MNEPVVVRNVEQPPADVVAALEKFGVTTVHEVQGVAACSPPTCGRFFPAPP